MQFVITMCIKMQKECRERNSRKIEERKNRDRAINAGQDAMRKMRKRNCKIFSCIRQLTVVANFDFCCRCVCNAILPPSIPPPSCCADTSSSSPRIYQRHRMCTKWSPSSTPAGTSSISPNLFSTIQIDFAFSDVFDL